MIDPKELDVNDADLENGADVLLAEEGEHLVNAALIIGQLDPTEIDTSSMLPRWTDAQRELISRAREQLGEWRDE
jgi:hypothetical protein